MEALGTSRGSRFSAGLVFIDGQYVAPPYRVERWGNVIRINGRNVTGQVIEWSRFLSTQSLPESASALETATVRTGAVSTSPAATPSLARPRVDAVTQASKKASRRAPLPNGLPGTAATSTVSAVAMAMTSAVTSAPPRQVRAEAKADVPTSNLDPSKDEELSLDDLFADKPNAKSKTKRKSVRRAPRPATVAPSKRTVVAAEGEPCATFRPNAESKKLLAQIDKTRLEIETRLRTGGFVIFSSGNSRVSGDAKTAQLILSQMPELLRNARSPSEFRSAARAAGFVYLTDRMCDDLYAHRFCYRALQERALKEQSIGAVDRLLNGAAVE